MLEPTAAAVVGASEDWYTEEDDNRHFTFDYVRGPWGDEVEGDDAWLEDGEDEDFGAADQRVEDRLPPLSEPGPDGKWDVTLHVYDLAQGASKNASAMYPDVVPVDAVWQVSRQCLSSPAALGGGKWGMKRSGGSWTRRTLQPSYERVPSQVGLGVHGREWTYCAYQGAFFLLLPPCSRKPSLLGLPAVVLSSFALAPRLSAPPSITPCPQASGTAPRATASTAIH